MTEAKEIHQLVPVYGHEDSQARTLGFLTKYEKYVFANGRTWKTAPLRAGVETTVPELSKAIKLPETQKPEIKLIRIYVDMVGLPLDAEEDTSVIFNLEDYRQPVFKSIGFKNLILVDSKEHSDESSSGIDLAACFGVKGLIDLMSNVVVLEFSEIGIRRYVGDSGRSKRLADRRGKIVGYDLSIQSHEPQL